MLVWFEFRRFSSGSFASFSFAASLASALVLSVSPVTATQSPQPDAPVLVAAARQAMGGDAAIAAVSSLTFSGTLTQQGPVSTSSAFEVNWIAPDKFLRVLRRTNDLGPMGSFQMTTYDGLNGDVPIHAIEAPDSPFPVTIAGPPPATPDAVAAAAARRVASAREACFEALIPLLVAPPGPWGLQVAAAGTGEVDKMQVDLLDIKPTGARMYRLMLDSKTHLPIRLTWMAKPVVIQSAGGSFTTETVVRRGPGGGSPQIMSPPTVTAPAALPSGDPTAGLLDVQWEMIIGDYKVADGLNWPRRFRTSFDGKKWQDLRISRYRLNRKLDPKMFDRN